MKTRKTASCVFRLFYILILFSAFISFASVSSAATYDVYGGIKAYWPDGSWIPVPSLGDPDDGVTERLDFVGDTLTSGGDGTNYAFYKYADSLYIYFRVRVDAGTWGGIKGLDPGGEWTDNIWIMLDANADNDPDYAIAWDSNTWDPGVTEPHGLEFQVIDKSSSTWSGTRFDDIDRLDSKKLVEAGTGPGKCNCECGRGNNCWHTDIPYSGGTGYVRIVDEQTTTTWGSTMFIDIAVTWSYLVSASSKANECNPNLPVLSAYGTWKLQMGSRNNANDHAAISTDVGANSNPSDALVWSDETKPLPPDPVLTISKSAPLDVTVDPAGTGTIIQYTGVLTNTTQAYAYDVVLVDTLPGGVTFVASSHNAVYDSILNTVTWQLGTMGPGTFIPGWLTVKVDASTPNETVLTNQFSVTWKDFDSSDFGPTTAAADTTVYSHPQLSVKKSGPLSAIHNEQFSYNITIRNIGDSPAFHIALEDALPPGLAYVGSSPWGTYNSGPPAMVIWNDLGGLDANSFKIVTVTVKVNDTVPNATVLMDTVNLIWEDSLENSYGPVISSADTTIYALPHLEITKSGPLEAEAGSIITYTGELTNTGGTAATNVVLVDSLPSGVTFISSSQSAVYDPVSNTVTWNLGTIGPGVSLPGWLTVQINGDITDASLLTNTFTATGEDALGNPLPEAKAKAFTTVYTHPLLAIEKSGPSTSYPGHTVTYTIQVTNNGGSAALDVMLMDSLPDGLTYQSSNPAGTHAAGLVTWNLDTIQSGGTRTVVVTVTVDATVANGTPLTDTASVIWENAAEQIFGPVTATADTTLYTLPHLEITKSGPLEAEAGSIITYTGELTNTGGTAATNVVLVDSLPSGVTFISSSQSAVYDPVSNTVTWNLGTIGPGVSLPGWLTVQINGDVTDGSILTNVFTAKGENTLGNPVPAATATADTTVYTHPLLAIEKSGPSTSYPGHTVTYTIQVTNNGGSAALDVMLMDSLPDGLTYQSSNPAGTHAAGLVTWNLDTIQSGGTRTVVVTVTVDATVANGTPLTDTASVIWENAAEQIFGPVTASAQTSVYTNPRISILKTGPDTAYPGETLTYEIEVCNEGGSNAQDVVLMDSLPDGLTYQSSNPAGTHAAGLVTWNLGTMISNACQTITLTVKVDASAADGTYPDLAQVTWKDMSTGEYGPASVVKETVVHTHPFLGVSKTGPSEAFTGENLTYTIQVSNIGGTSALNVSLSDNLPIGLSYQSSNPAGNHTGGMITWDLDTIQYNESKAVTVTVIADVTVANGTLLKDTAVITWENGVGEVFGPVTATADTTIYRCPGITLIPDPGPLPDGTVGVSYQQVISAEGGTGPYTYQLTRGTLPDGLNLIPGSIVISGIPSAEGAWEFMIVATDEGHGCAIAHEYSITINAVPATIPALTGWGITIIFSLFSVTSILWIKRRSFNK